MNEWSTLGNSEEEDVSEHQPLPLCVWVCRGREDQAHVPITVNSTLTCQRKASLSCFCQPFITAMRTRTNKMIISNF